MFLLRLSLNGALLRLRIDQKSLLRTLEASKTVLTKSLDSLHEPVSWFVLRAAGIENFLYFGGILHRKNPKLSLISRRTTLLVGRLGLEPRQSASKALDLP